ncbi:MAG: hypothetical protein ACM3W4_01695 [Ignavibacteriales bacterium]
MAVNEARVRLEAELVAVERIGGTAVLVRATDLRTLLATPTQGEDNSSSRDHALSTAAKLEELRLFLNGEGELEGCTFGGDAPQLIKNRAYWWRAHLPVMAEAAALLSSQTEVAGRGPGMQNNTSGTPTQEGVGRFSRLSNDGRAEMPEGYVKDLGTTSTRQMMREARAAREEGVGREEIARCLFECEKKRSDATDRVIAMTAGRPVKFSMARDWSEAADHDRTAFLSDAEAVLSLLPDPKPGEGDCVLVPREPTGPMCSAGFAEWNRTRAGDVKLIYRAMIAAAPEPQQPAPGAPDGWREALEELRAALEKANSDGLITDTIWVGDAPLFDFIDLALTSSSAKPVEEDVTPLVAALTALAEHGIPTDTQELLLRGHAVRSIPPGALKKAVNAALTSSSAKPTEEDAEQIERRIEAGGVAGVCFYDNYTPAKRLASLKHQARQKGQTAVVVHNPALLADDLETFDIPSAKPEKEGEYSAKPGGEDE